MTGGASRDRPALNPALAFGVAWAFWAIAAAIGVVLRWHVLRPVPGLEYAYVLHAHSHVAFLGWVFNAFFALALQVFVPPGETGRFRRLFVVAQVAVAGMLASYPFQGYARESITFSTLHLICAGVFMVKLLRRNTAGPAARRYLAAAFGCMLVSGLGPLTLGPLAAMGMRESPWYLLCIYFYLHFQYNGWFILFLLAVLVQRLEATGATAAVAGAVRAWPWLLAGTVLSFALSALWLHPPGWVYACAAAGGAALLIATGQLRGLVPGAATAFAGSGPLVRVLAAIAGALLVLKHGFQFAGSFPGIAELANQRTVVIGFLHLIFLGIVTPMLIAWAVTFGWIQLDRLARIGLAGFAVGAALTELLLFLPPVALRLRLPPEIPWSALLFGSAALMALGVGAMLSGLGPAARADAAAPRGGSRR